MPCESKRKTKQKKLKTPFSKEHINECSNFSRTKCYDCSHCDSFKKKKRRRKTK